MRYAILYLVCSWVGGWHDSERRSRAGSGYYVDDEVGGCVATGDGDKIMRYCMSIQVVNLLSTGMHPNEACAAVIRTTAKRSPDDVPWVALAAVDNKGRYGASCSFPTWPDQITGIVYPGFPYAVWIDGESSIHVAPSALGPGKE